MTHHCGRCASTRFIEVIDGDEIVRICRGCARKYVDPFQSERLFGRVVHHDKGNLVEVELDFSEIAFDDLQEQVNEALERALRAEGRRQ